MLLNDLKLLFDVGHFENTTGRQGFFVPTGLLSAGVRLKQRGLLMSPPGSQLPMVALTDKGEKIINNVLANVDRLTAVDAVIR